MIRRPPRSTRTDAPFPYTKLFRSLHRDGAAVWSVYVATRWYDLHAQISAGVNTAMSGLPNWTHDIGGFSVEPRYAAENPKPEDLAEWRELNLRWFQFGAFSPLFRSHGEMPWREIFEISPEEIGRASCRERVCQYV